MKHFILLLVVIFITVNGSLWSQKVVNKADILSVPEWKQIYDAYTPDAALIESLKNKAPQLKADVYFGYWCGDSKKNVPVFLKILDTLNVPEFKVNFYEVEKKLTADQKYYVKDLMIEKVPTFIFYVNDFEMDRIVENPRTTILQDMLLIEF
jgi:thiol-disulfide isomerase/thioredoxin